jgi:hypothetical protein
MAKGKPTIEVVFNGQDCLVLVDGLKIAKRGVEKKIGSRLNQVGPFSMTRITPMMRSKFATKA